MSRFKIVDNIYILSKVEHILDTNTECIICRNNLNEESIFGDTSAYSIKKGLCGHVFHNDCMTPWLKKSKQCPLCFNNWL